MQYKGKEVQITPQEINQKLDKLIKNNTFNPNFKFRPEQRKAIVKIAFLNLNKICKNVIVDAPTGSGKSIIAIVTSKLLREWKKTGYIITSNLELQQQYQNDIQKFSFLWGSVKGMKNYDCDVNGKNFTLGECKTRGFGTDKTSKLACYQTCGYFQNRLRAMSSAVSVLNYSYWLLQRNYVAEKMTKSGEKENFPKRDFVFFDEAHKIDDIVQSHFSVKISQKILERITILIDTLDQEDFLTNEVDLTSLLLDYSAIMDEESFDENMIALRNFKKVLSNLVTLTPIVKDYINKNHPFEYNKSNKVPKKYSGLLSDLEILKDVNCKISDYLEIVERAPNNFVKTMYPDKEEVVFNLLEDVDLVKMKLHNHSNFSIFMSATFGNPSIWADLVGTDDYEVVKIPNYWNYAKSPIIITHSPKLNWKNREASLPSAIKKIDIILEDHKGEKGIIHTGNFYFTSRILSKSKYKKRLFSYTNTREKIEIMKDFNRSSDGVLIGPSLIEGLDLADDQSRFQIFLKVPYRQITDNFIQQKMKYDSTWYNWKTSIAFTQAIGRSIRNDNDWAITYLIDGCFKDFIRYNAKTLEEIIVERMEYEA